MANSANKQLEDGYQLCPFCKEKIRIGARKCRWCMEYLDADDNSTAGASAGASVAPAAEAFSTAATQPAPINAPKLEEKFLTAAEEEVVHLKMHPTYKRLLPPLSVSLLAILGSIPFLRSMEASMYLLLLVIAVCFVWFVKLFVEVLTTTYLLDDKRVIVSEGFFIRRKVEIRIEDIRAVWLKQNIIEQLLNIGDVQVGTSATAGTEISIANIDSPMEVHDLLRTLIG